MIGHYILLEIFLRKLRSEHAGKVWSMIHKKHKHIHKTWSLHATIDCSIVEWSQFIQFSVHKSNLWAFLEKAWTLSRTLVITSSSACNIYLFHAEICRYLKNFCCAFYCMKSSVWISQYCISLYLWCILIKYLDHILHQCLIQIIRERLDIIKKYHYHYTFLLYWIINVYITKTHNLSFRCLYLRHHAFVLNNKYMVVRFWYIVHNLIHIRARAFIMRRIAENARKPKSDIWGI